MRLPLALSKEEGNAAPPANQPRRRLGDAVGHLLGMPSPDDAVAHASSVAADADVPVLVAKLEAHVQIARLSRKLVP